MVLRMRKRFEVKENKWAPRKWFVEGRENGKRNRKFFKTKAEAKAYVELKNIELENKGREHVEFDSRLRDMAQDCADKLKVFGKTIEDATKHFIAHLDAVEKSCTVAQLVDAVIATKTTECGNGRPASRDYLADLKVRLGRFKKTFAERMVATITTDEIRKWLNGLKDDRTGENLSPLSRGNYARALSVAFSFAIEEKFAPNSPMTLIKKPAAAAGDIGILDVDQARSLLNNASAEILPFFAIGLFAGLRRAEIERLDWSEIDFDSGLIEVTAAKAKGARRRLVPIQPNLREWLMPLRKLSGKVVPDNFRRAFDQARQAAGITEWPGNALRHSFASYHLAHFKNLNALTLEMGHTNSQMLFEHYRELVKPKEAERYWNIRPTPVADIVPITTVESPTQSATRSFSAAYTLP
jgi:integrase